MHIWSPGLETDWPPYASNKGAVNNDGRVGGVGFEIGGMEIFPIPYIIKLTLRDIF